MQGCSILELDVFILVVFKLHKLQLLNEIDYIQIMSTGNAVDFGDLTLRNAGTNAPMHQMVMEVYNV